MKIVLCRQGFTNDYVEKIKSQVPEEIRITETTLPDEHGERNTQYVLLLFGSRQTQAEQAVKIKILHAGQQSFTCALSKLGDFFQKNLISSQRPPSFSSPTSEPLAS